MRRVLSLLVLLLLLFGCSLGQPTTDVEPRDGPAATEETTEPPVVEGEPGDDEPTGEPTGPAEAPPASFKEKVVYPDGVEVEVIKIRHTELEDYGAASGDAKAGAPVTILSVRVRNGSGKSLDTSAGGTLTYGPDGEESQTVSQTGIESADGRILPGKAKTGTYGFVLPVKYRSDVVLEFSWDNTFERGPAIFTGSVK